MLRYLLDSVVGLPLLFLTLPNQFGKKRSVNSLACHAILFLMLGRAFLAGHYLELGLFRKLDFWFFVLIVNECIDLLFCIQVQWSVGRTFVISRKRLFRVGCTFSWISASPAPGRIFCQIHVVLHPRVLFIHQFSSAGCWLPYLHLKVFFRFRMDPLYILIDTGLEMFEQQKPPTCTSGAAPVNQSATTSVAWAQHWWFQQKQCEWPCPFDNFVVANGFRILKTRQQCP